MMSSPSDKRAKELLALGRDNLRTTRGLLTGYNTLRSHQKVIGNTNQDLCRLCEEKKEDSIHVICECPILAIKRLKM